MNPGLIVIAFLLLAAVGGLWAWRRWRRQTLLAKLVEEIRTSPEFQRRIEETTNRLLNMKKWQVRIHSKSGRELTAGKLASMAATAFSRSVSVRTGDFDCLDAAFLASEGDGNLVAGAGPLFYVALTPYLFEVMDLDLQGWRLITVCYTPSATYAEELQHGFRWTGKLAAQFVGEGDVTVNLEDAEFPDIGASKAAGALCTDDPLAAFENLKTAQVPEDD